MTPTLPALHHVNGESEIRLVGLSRIRVLNPRVRNKKIFARLVENIATLGLKRPITVAEGGKDETGKYYDLICGQGRYEAYQMLGEKEIPCVVVQASEIDRYLISLVENLARRKHSNHDLLDAVRILEDRGYNNAQIAQKTGLDPSYIYAIIYLLRQGEERLIGAVEAGWLSISMAAEIARSGDDEIQSAMMQAYESGLLKGDQLMRVRRLITQRTTFGKGYRRGWHRRGDKNVTPQKLLKTYQAEVRRQKLMVKKAEINDQRLLFVTTALRRLMADEHFLTLLRAESIQDMPQPLAERVRGGGACMTQVRMGFEAETIRVPIQNILPTRLVGQDVLKSVKYQAILASIRELGIVEPLAVHPEKRVNGDTQHFILLDGHSRLEALKELGDQEAVCLVSTDDEGFTYNRQINRISAIQEHRMILAAIKKGVPAERIAQVLNVNVDRIHARQHLLDGIAPEVVELLKDRMIGQQVFRVLRKMKPMRQIEAAEMMLSANRFTQSYIDMILVATRPEQLVDKKKTKHSEVTPEDIAHMEREMEKLHHDYQLVEETLGETMLVLVVAKGYLSRLMRNEAISDYLKRHHKDLSEELSSVMEAVTTDTRNQERE